MSRWFLVGTAGSFWQWLSLIKARDLAGRRWLTLDLPRSCWLPLATTRSKPSTCQLDSHPLTEQEEPVRGRSDSEQAGVVEGHREGEPASASKQREPGMQGASRKSGQRDST